MAESAAALPPFVGRFFYFFWGGPIFVIFGRFFREYFREFGFPQPPPPPFTHPGSATGNPFNSITYLLTYCPLCLLAGRAVTKTLHSCLSWAILWIDPQVWWRLVISFSTVRRQVFLGRPVFSFLLESNEELSWLCHQLSFSRYAQSTSISFSLVYLPYSPDCIYHTTLHLIASRQL